MATRYQPITQQIRMDIAVRVGGLLWEAAETKKRKKKAKLRRKARSRSGF